MGRAGRGIYRVNTGGEMTKLDMGGLLQIFFFFDGQQWLFRKVRCQSLSEQADKSTKLRFSITSVVIALGSGLYHT